MADSPQSEKATATTNESRSRVDPSPSQYQFANNPAMQRAWIRNLLFGFAITLPLSMVGLAVELWQAKDLLLIYGVVVVTCLGLLPIYAAIIRELP